MKHFVILLLPLIVAGWGQKYEKARLRDVQVLIHSIYFFAKLDKSELDDINSILKILTCHYIAILTLIQYTLLEGKWLSNEINF